MVSYQDSAVDIETRYTVEFVNNKKDWDYICKGIFNHGEPWERYQSRKYSSLDDAITFYLVHYFSDATYDVRLCDARRSCQGSYRQGWRKNLQHADGFRCGI